MAGQIKAVRGMKDILPPETSRWQWVEQVAREVFELYGYSEVRLPLLERTELFARSIGADTDIVAKEMYTFSDRRGDSLTLRPEATAQVVRACLENGLLKTAGVKKFYLIGPMFRYERPQKGRFRQFYQINCEALGSDAPELDAEVILLLLDFLGRLGLQDLQLLINSLGCPECTPDFKARLQQYLAEKKGWCDDCRRRRVTNPLRVLWSLPRSWKTASVRPARLITAGSWTCWPKPRWLTLKIPGWCGDWIIIPVPRSR